MEDVLNRPTKEGSVPQILRRTFVLLPALLTWLGGVLLVTGIAFGLLLLLVLAIAWYFDL